MKYGNVTLSQIEAAINKLGGQENFERLLRCNSVNVTFSDDKAEIVATDPTTSIWKTITIGTIARDQFGSTLKERGMNVKALSNNMMWQETFIVTQKEQQIDLAVVSVAELGFDKPTRYDAICARAKELGLELCPPEVGPQLRLQYLDQPLDEWLCIAMEAIIPDPSDDLNIFVVEHLNNGLWLDSSYGGPCFLWAPNDRFVFCLRKQPSDA